MNGRSLFSVQLFTFLFVLYIKVFYICNHYNFIGMKQTAVTMLFIMLCISGCVAFCMVRKKRNQKIKEV